MKMLNGTFFVNKEVSVLLQLLNDLMMNVILKFLLGSTTIWVIYTFSFLWSNFKDDLFLKADISPKLWIKEWSTQVVSTMYVYKKIIFCHPTQVVLTTKFSGFGAKKLGSHTTNYGNGRPIMFILFILFECYISLLCTSYVVKWSVFVA